MRTVYLLLQDNEVLRAYASLDSVIEEVQRLNEEFPSHEYTHKSLSLFER